MRASGRSVGSRRTPLSAIVAATVANWSGVASTLPWPIAVEPTASGPPTAPARGSVLGRAPGMSGRELKPKRSAVSTRRCAPTFTPSGANTELHDSAKLLANVPPQNSPFAFSRSTPSIVVLSCTGNGVVSFTSPASSAAVAVTILKVEPGGCGAENATPASARISQVRGSSAAIPP